jgi:gliding motility-associated-like protein
VTNEAILNDVQWYDLNSGANVASGTAYYELWPGKYRAEVVTNEGCENEGETEVGTEIAPYNGISNNGDNQNDFFIIDCITNFPNNNVKIYNRSGILVYEQDGYNNADLSFKGIGERGLYLQGINLPVGTYFYIIDKRDGSKPVAGYLELDR